jgi:hypothetical protein
MFEFFAWLKMFPDGIKRIFGGANSAPAAFIMGIIRNWYFAMTIPAIWAVYYLFKALETSGIMDKFQAIVTSTMSTINNITIKCFPLIADLKSMIACINGVN